MSSLTAKQSDNIYLIDAVWIASLIGVDKASLTMTAIF
jgi:hypothetical protein